MDTEGATFISHLVELRDRLMRGIGAVLIVFLCLTPVADPLYEFLASPLMAALPEGASMIATEVHTTFFVPFKLAFAVAVIITIPYLLYQLWAFVAPGLYENEKKLALPLVVSSSALFYLGILFAYFVVFPLVFSFFSATAPEGVTMMTDINAYLSFVLKLFFAFGVAFEVPVATVILVRMGMTTPENLKQKRPYIIVAAFVVGMLLTPPDIISQTLLALPVWVLFEIGLYFSKHVEPQSEEDDDDDEESADGAMYAGSAVSEHLSGKSDSS